MKKILLILPITIALTIFFFPTKSSSNSTGSVGGKTGSPNDNASCTQCHNNAVLATGATITTNIPSTGYIPGDIYTINANINQSGVNIFGFEITAEENAGSTKTGDFYITNSNETQFTNNSTAVTHKAGGTSGTNGRSWSMDWEAPNSGTGAVTFYGGYVSANGNGNQNGDTYHSATLTVNEAIALTAINLSKRNDFIYNSIGKRIESNKTISVYNIKGNQVLKTNSSSTNISHLNAGIYILKSAKKTQKIILN